MFKFLRGQKKQQNTENAGIPDPPVPDTINYENAESGVEEVLKPLFLREEPILYKKATTRTECRGAPCHTYKKT